MARAGGFFRRHFVRARPVELSARARRKLQTYRYKYRPDDEEEPLTSDERIQSASGMLVPGQEPLVPPDLEDRSIVVQMTFGICFSRYEAFYVSKRLPLSQEEFADAIAELNRVLRSPPLWSYLFAPCCCVPGCWRDEAIKRKADELTKRFEKKGVSFRITSRLYQGWAGEYEQNLKSADYLVVTHEQPSMAEMEMAPMDESSTESGSLMAAQTPGRV